MLPYSKYFTGLIIIIIANIYSIYYVPGTILITYVCVCMYFIHTCVHVYHLYIFGNEYTHTHAQFTFMILSHPHFDPRKFIFIFQKRKLQYREAKTLVPGRIACKWQS